MPLYKIRVLGGNAGDFRYIVFFHECYNISMSQESWNWKPAEKVRAANDNLSPDEILKLETPPEVDAALQHVMALPADIRQSVMADMRYFMFNQELVLSTLPQSQDITDFIVSLRGFANSEKSFRAAKEAIADFTLQNLVDGILDSKESDWKTKPSHFLALVSENHARLDRLRSLAPKK